MKKIVLILAITLLFTTVYSTNLNAQDVLIENVVTTYGNYNVYIITDATGTSIVDVAFVQQSTGNFYYADLTDSSYSASGFLVSGSVSFGGVQGANFYFAGPIYPSSPSEITKEVYSW